MSCRATARRASARRLLFLCLTLLLPALVFCGCRGRREAETTAAPAATTSPVAAPAPTQPPPAGSLPQADAAASAAFSRPAGERFSLALTEGDYSLETRAPVRAEGCFHSAVLAVPNRVFAVSVPEGAQVKALTFRSGGASEAPVADGDLWYACENERLVFVVTPPAGSSDPSAPEILILDPDAVTEEGSGLFSVSPVWGGAGSFGGMLGLAADEIVSAPMPLSRGGLGVLFGGDESTAARAFRAAAFRLTDSGLEPAGDPALEQLFPAGRQTAESLYLPEAEGVFAVLILNAADDPALLTITGGRAEIDAAHRLGGLFSLNVKVGETAAGNKYVDAVYFSGDTYMLGQYYLGAMLPAADVSRVRCDPRYELIVLYWQPDASGVLKNTASQWNGPQPGRPENPRGAVSFTPDGRGEWLLLCVRRRAQPLLNAAGELTLKSPGMGGLRGCAEVESGVLVEYAPGRAPTFEGISDPVVAQNLRDFASLRAGHVYAGVYARPQAPDQAYPYPEMTDVSPVWYNGRFSANSFIQSVTPVSYLTAAANPNSRYYMFSDPRGYGATCLDVVYAMFGITENYKLSMLYGGEPTKFERAAFNARAELETLTPGEILMQFDPTDHSGHIALVSEVQRGPDGTVRAVTVTEGWTPYARQRTFYVCGAAAETGLLKYYMASQMEVFNVRLRVKKQYIRALRDLFELPEHVSVGTVMCDRGSDSLYCMGDPFAEFSVSDESAAELRVYRDGVPCAVVPLADAERRNGLRVVGFSHLLTQPGLYTVYTDTSAEPQERFFVPEKKAAPTLRLPEKGSASAVARLTVPDFAEADCVYLFYRRNGAPPDSEPDPSSEPRYVIYTLPVADLAAEPASSGAGSCDVPAAIGGGAYSLVLARTQYRTPYGAFWVGYQGKTLCQSAECW